MISENANLLTRRKFLAMLPSLPSLLFFGNKAKTNPNQPKFQIGDYVEFRWEDTEAGVKGWERGFVLGISMPEAREDREKEWDYKIKIEESLCLPSCIGSIAECYESELFPASRPMGVRL